MHAGVKNNSQFFNSDEIMVIREAIRYFIRYPPSSKLQEFKKLFEKELISIDAKCTTFLADSIE